MKSKRTLRHRTLVVLANIALVLAGALLVEAGARLVGVTPESIDPALRAGFGTDTYPLYYFMANDARGFDIAPGVPMTTFNFIEAKLDVFSNRYGCFDANEKIEGPYVLLLGDSFAWGYAPYEAKWGTLLEKRLGVTVAKCGVSHTGQKFQLSKGRDVVSAIGRAPKLVVVSHFLNDPDDDLLYPQATVVEGYLTDQATYEGGGIRRLDRSELLARYEEWKSVGRSAKFMPDADGVTSLRRNRFFWFLRRRSVVANAIYTSIKRSRKMARGEAGPLPRMAEAENQKAIGEMKAWADSIGARLLFVLVAPNLPRSGDYASVQRFLDANGIDYVDLRPRFDEAPRRADLFWEHDFHWNAAGNRLAAEAVAVEIERRYPAILQK